MWLFGTVRWKILVFPRTIPSFWWSLFWFSCWVQSVIFWRLRYWHWVVKKDGSQSRSYIGIFCFVFRSPREATGLSYAKIAVGSKWLWGSRHTFGTAKGIDLCVSLNQSVNVLEHKLQQIFGAQILSWSPNLRGEIKFLSFPHKWWWRLRLSY